jgi:outer membrane protein OmpA-like peptidoglycan-associated protein
MRKRLFLISAFTGIVLCFLSGFLFGQGIHLCPKTESKKAARYLNEAKDLLRSRKDYDQARDLLLKAAREDTSFAEPWLLLGDAANRKGDWKTMRQAYTRLIELCPDADAQAYYRLGTYLFEVKDYEKSTSYLKTFLEFGSADERQNKLAETYLFRARMIANPVPFDPQPVKGISTADPEYLAIISPDNEFCFFTRRYEEVKKGQLTPTSAEKFIISKRQSDGEFEKGEPMPLPFNMQTSNNEGGATISKDNKFIYFTKNENGNFDLFYSENIKGVWGPITNLGPTVNDPKQWDSQPSLSPDGKTLYFASYRDSVNGTSDIFVTEKTNGGFSTARSLPFNTTGNEKSAFIHPDNMTLYFSSDSLPGMGGFDIFMVKKENGKWGKPVNLGYPINTEADEVGFFVSTDGNKGYFASNKLAGAGGYDIYSFDLPDDKKPEKVLFVKGQLKNDNNEIPLAARIEMRKINTNEVINVEYDTLTGNYASVVLFDSDYIMTVKKDGHAFNSQYFAETDTTIKTVVKADLDVRKINVGEAYPLNNILFDTNSSILTKSSRNIILDFAAFLRENPRLRVAIHGHTDTEGDPQSNLRLSNDRAKAVYDFLVSTGINAARLSYKGFGQTKPVAGNETTEGRALNRRTEFVVVEK